MLGIILLGHGSRDPQWRAPLDAVADRIRARHPGAMVTVAFLELSAPSLQGAMADLAARGVQRLRVLPVFFGMGKHAREDLPAEVQQLRQAHPELQIEVLPSIGEHPAVLDLLASLAAP